MAVSLYDTTIVPYLRGLRTTAHTLEKAKEWCKQNELLPSFIIDARLTPDMRPLSFQIRAIVLLMRSGTLPSPFFWISSDTQPLEDEQSFEGLISAVDAEIARLESTDWGSMDANMSREYDMWTGGELLVSRFKASSGVGVDR
ncbi:Hypothetical protein D9617_21g096770 [Elsinoe fawcettii]|nr:Hypothetical protein D9617_21g096770 [Elsinoe fawcettii]